MIIIPYNTDAPIYYFPGATIGLIIVNWFVFAAQVAIPEFTEYFWLQFGVINPIQWLTSFFLHGDLFHLIGNMLFLWGFGIVVEGKIGWWRFLLVYLAVGAIVSVLIQLLMLGATEGAALGASAAIFGMIGIAMVWAPVNQLQCKFIAILIFFPIFAEFEIAIFIAAFIYIALDFLYVMITGFEMSGAFAHLLGAMVGAAIGFVSLKSRLVDCEGFDIIAMMRGTLGEKPKPTLAQEKELHEQAAIKKQEFKDGVANFKKYVASGHVEFAVKKFQQLKRIDPKLRMDASSSWSLIKGLIEKNKFSVAVNLIEDHIDQHAETRATMLLNLSKIYLIHLERPRKSLATLNRLTDLKLDEKQVRVATKLRENAFKAISDGAIELE